MRTGQLAAAGASMTAALSGGFHLAWAISAGLGITALVIAAVMLRADQPRSASVAPAPEDVDVGADQDVPELDEACA
jgi:hypothetical protein